MGVVTIGREQLEDGSSSAWAEVNGETVCAVSRESATEVEILVALATALVEHAHEMPRTYPAADAGVDRCAAGKFAHAAADGPVCRILDARAKVAGLVVVVDNDRWYAHDPNDDDMLRVDMLRGDDCPTDLAVDALAALGIKAEWC